MVGGEKTHDGGVLDVGEVGEEKRGRLLEQSLRSEAARRSAPRGESEEPRESGGA